MTSGDISKRLTELYQRVQDLRTQSLGNPDQAVKALSDALDELKASLEELSAAEEELRQQKEELIVAQENLGDSEEKYRRIVETANEGIWVVDSEAMTTYVNKRMSEMLGCSPEEIIGRKSSDFMDEEGKAQVGVNLERRQRGITESFEFKLVRKDGSPLWVISNATPFLDKNGRFAGSLGMLTDITERKQAMSEIESLAKFPDENPSPVLRVVADGAITYANRNSAPLLRQWSCWSGQKLPDNYRDLVLETLRTGNCSEIEVTSGSAVYSLVLSPIVDMGYVNIYGLDITQRKKVEVALKEREERYRRLFEVESDAVFLVDCETGEFIDANPAALRMYGYTLGEILQLKASDVSTQPAKTLQSIAAREENIPLCWHCKKDGTAFPVEITGNYFECQGRIIHVAAIRDITSRKSIETRLKQSESRYRTLFKHSPIPTLEEDYSKVKSRFDLLRSSGISDFREYFHSHPAEVVSLASMVKVQDINRTGRVFFKICDMESIPTSRSGCFTDSSYKVFIEELAALAEGNTRFESETPIRTMEGDNKIVSLKLSVAPGYENTLSRVLVSFVDITERRMAEEALQDSEEKYRLVVENANEGIILAQEGFIKFANSGMAKLLGRTLEEIIARPFQEFIYPDDRAMVVGRHKRRIAGEQIEDVYAFRIVTGDGSMRWVEISVVSIEWQGHPATLSFLSDITKRKEIEADLRRSREKYHNIFQNSILGLYQSIPSGRYLSVNPAFARLFGYKSPEEIIESVTDIGHQLYANNQDRERAIKLITEQGFLEGFELEVRRRDGTKFWVSMNTRIMQEEDGTHFDGTVEDITRRKQAEEGLKESERRLIDIINFLPDATLVIDREGRVIAWNRAIEALTEVKAEDILGKGNYEYALPFYGYRKPILIDLVLRPQEEIEKEYSNLKREDGTLIGEAFMPALRDGQVFLWGVASALYDSLGNIVGAIESIRDITGRKQADDSRETLVKELESKNIEMERFIYTVSHDLRSPLVTISGFTGVLKSDLVKGNLESVDTDLSIINSTISKMDLLLRDTLELSRIGRVANPPDTVSFEDIAIDALNQLMELAKAKGVKVKLASDLPSVYVDHMRMVEVMVNLIENSIKHMGDQTCPKIEIGYRQNDGVFFVKDNGIGIDPSQHHKVFELFYKIDKKSEGTGAGLAIVKRIVEVHGGRIWIESEKEKGCTVCFTLPLSTSK